MAVATESSNSLHIELLSYFRYRIRINNTLIETVLLFLTSTIASLLDFATTKRGCFTLNIASANKSSVICGTK